MVPPSPAGLRGTSQGLHAPDRDARGRETEHTETPTPTAGHCRVPFPPSPKHETRAALSPGGRQPGPAASPPALRKPRVQPVREASGSGSARGPSPRWLSPGQSASKLGSTLAARGQHGSVHPCHVDLVTRPSRRGDRRWPRARAVCRGSVLPGVRETIFSPTQLKGGIQSIGNQKHGLRPYKE